MLHFAYNILPYPRGKQKNKPPPQPTFTQEIKIHIQHAGNFSDSVFRNIIIFFCFRIADFAFRLNLMLKVRAREKQNVFSTESNSITIAGPIL